MTEEQEPFSITDALSTMEHRNVAHTVEILLSFQKLKQQGLSAAEIANTMNLRGLEPPGGGTWTEGVVTRVDDLIRPQEDALRQSNQTAPQVMIDDWDDHRPSDHHLSPEASPDLAPGSAPWPESSSAPWSDSESNSESNPGWTGPKGLGVALLTLAAIVAVGFGLVAINERRASDESASAVVGPDQGQAEGGETVTGDPDGQDGVGGSGVEDDASIPTVPTPAEGEEAPDPEDMMTIQIEPQTADTDDGAGGVDPATATVKADGLLHLEGAFPNQAEADGYIDGLAKVFGRENIVESYGIDPAAPLPTVSDVSLDKPVLFETGTAIIDPSYIPFLEACGDVLKLNPQITMSIAAFTDSAGDEQFNLELSQQRAQAIYDFYRSIEVDETQLVSVGYGEADPVADNGTEAGREQNRRAILQLLDVVAEQSG